MSDTFVLSPEARRPPAPRRRVVLVTGAAGNIGSYLARAACERYALRLMLHAQDDPACVEGCGECVQGDIQDLDRMKELCQGVDTVLHLAGSARPDAVWDQLLRNNIIGTYNVFVAAHAAGCRRVIYASSIHAVSGYPAGRQVHADEPVNPGDLYGVSKCFGEALARYMAEQRGLSSIILRIGAFQPLETARHPDSTRLIDAFVSQRDMTQLIFHSIDNEDLRFAILHGLSKNTFNRMDISETCQLVGYQPQDDLGRENPRLQPLGLDQLQNHSEKDGQEPGIREQL